MASVAIVLGVVFNILKVVFGLGFVIFIHELGHFLAAKWAGVKVEKFFLGFDPYGLRVLSFRRGETLYGVGAIPLGGYVKMLGESDEGATEQTDDPRAFSNKSVGARTVILSAGVVMNLILGMVLFTSAYMSGVKEIPAILGAVDSASPAFEAGLKPGDEIVSINGRGDVNFMRLSMKTSLTPAGRPLNLVVKRRGVAEPIPITVFPKRQAKSDRPTIGIAQAASLDLSETKPYEALPGTKGPAPKPEEFPKGGKVIEAGRSAGPTAVVDDYFAFERVLVANRGVPIDVVIEVRGKEGSSPNRARVTLPVVQWLTPGFRLTPGPVASIQAGSIAERAGFQKGDRIVRVDSRDDVDPLQLPAIVFESGGQADRVPRRADHSRQAGDEGADGDPRRLAPRRRASAPAEGFAEGSRPRPRDGDRVEGRRRGRRKPGRQGRDSSRYGHHGPDDPSGQKGRGPAEIQLRHAAGRREGRLRGRLVVRRVPPPGDPQDGNPAHDLRLLDTRRPHA